MRILLVEDDFDLSENLIEFLTDEGYHCDFAHTGEVAIELLHENTYDVIILDICLPGIDGFEVCKKLRQVMGLNIPVIMLTARTSITDKLCGFDSGTDDYLSKPFEIAELKVRIEALSKRTRPLQSHIITVGDLVYNVDEGIVKRADVVIQLPPVCLQLLHTLMEASPNIVSKSDLEYSVWGVTPPETNALKAHLYTLRNLIDKPFDKKLISTIRGQGYKIVGDEL